MNWTLLQNSLLVAGLTTVFAAALGLMAALCFAGVAKSWRKLFIGLAVVALVLPPFLVVNCWLHYLGHTGVWRNLLPFNLFSLWGTVWVLVLLTWPITTLLALAAWRRVQPSHLETDPLLRRRHLIRRLLLPAGRTELGLAAVLTFVLAFNNFAVPAILQVRVYPAEIWVSFNTTFDYGQVWLLSWPLVVAPVLLLCWLRPRRLSWEWRQSPVSARLFRNALGGWWTGSSLLAALLLACSVLLPVWQLLASERTWSEFGPAFAAGRTAVLNSFALAAGTAAIVTAFGVIAARRRGRLLAWLPFFLPGVLLGVVLIWLLNRPGLGVIYTTFAIVILAWSIRYLAIAWTGAALAVRSADAQLTDVARLEGAGRWQLFRHVHWPQTAPLLAVVWYIVYLLCLWDVETLVLIVPPGGETLAVRIFNLLHYGHNAQVNALCILLLGLAVGPLLGWLAFDALAGFARRRPAPRVRAKKALRPATASLAVAAGAFLSSGCSDGYRLDSRFFSHVETIGSRGAGVGEFNLPRSVAVDAEDNVYVVDMTGRVQKFSPEGQFLLGWQMEQTDLGRPKGMDRDSRGNIIVIEPHYSRVNHFSPDGAEAAQWGVHGTNAGQLAFPRAVAVNSRGDLYVSEYGLRERVQKFSANGETFITEFGQDGRGPGQFNRPEGLGIDAHDRLYVADSCNHRIQVFGVDGEFLRSYGKPGGGLGELSYPYDIRVDAAGRQYVCEFGNSRLQVFDPEGNPIEIIGGPGTAPGQFSNPWSIAFDSQWNLYVADSRNHRVQKFVRRKNIAGGER